MELIKQLSIQNFPWLVDGIYILSQDTIVEWDYWSWKTSLLKAITWLLCEKDLQGKSIPNITDQTQVTSNWYMKLERTKEWLIWDIWRILKGWVNAILARIIPWYIFSWWITNKELVHIITNINMDKPLLWKKQNLWFFKKKIKEIKSYQNVLADISEDILNFTYDVKHALNYDDEILSKLYDLPKILQFHQDAIVVNKKIKDFINPLYKGLNKKESKDMDLIHIKKSGIKNYIYNFFKMKNKNDILAIMIKHFFSLESVKNKHSIECLTLWELKLLNISINYIIMKCQEYKENFIRRLQWIFLDVNYDNLHHYYDKILKKTLNLWELMRNKQLFIDEMYHRINDTLEMYWMNISWNNKLTIMVNYKWKTMSLLELPRSKRFLMEINLCSKLQLNYLNEFSDSASIVTWLILIDDYYFSNSNESIDLLLAEALSHQVILTINNTKVKKLKLTI